MRPIRSRIHGLIIVNAGLLVALGAVVFSPMLVAQGTPRRGQYTLVSGYAKGSDSGIVWVIDEVHQELIALTFRPNEKRLDGVGYRDLNADAATLAKSRG